MADSADVGKREIGGRDWVGEYDVGLTAELIEDLGEREDGAYGVTVRAGVRGEKEARMRAEGRQQIVDSGCVRLDFEDLGFWGHDLAGTPEAGMVAGGSDEERFWSRLRVRARSSSMRPVIFSERSMAKVSSGTWRTPMRSRSWDRM